MTTRSHHVIFATGCAIFVVITLLFLLQKTHLQLQDVQMRFLQSQSRLKSVSSQFDSLFEYKERLEKSLINLKNEKTSLLQIDDSAREDLSVVKSNCDRQIKFLQEALDDCRNSDSPKMMYTDMGPKSKGADVAEPVLESLVLQKPNLTVVSSSVQSLKTSTRLGPNKLHGHDPKDNEAVLSPIAHVPPHPGQPSGNPNEDTAGNVLI